MKHEAFARAMSQLDDELILQAHQNAAARQGALLWRRIRRIAAAAACLLLVLGAAWLFLPARVELTLPQPGQSVLSSEPGIAVQDVRRRLRRNFPLRQAARCALRRMAESFP